MKPGRELDALVAEKVMGLVEGKDFGEWPEHDWKRDEDGEVDIFAYDGDTHNGPVCVRCHYGYCHHCQSGPTQPCKVEPRRYSASISSAWEIMELVFGGRMTKHPRVLPSFSVIPIRDDVRTWMTAAPEGARFAVTIEEGGFFAYGETVPHAICLAALRAFGVSEGTPQPHETR